MALTDHCDLFVAVHDLGINRVVTHLFRQRPSLFNYATALVLRNPGMLCEKIDAHPVVTARGNPLLTLTPPLPVFGSDPPIAVNYSIQVRKPKIDFHPGGAFALPPELDPLPAQQFAVTAGACVGFGCPDPRLLAALPPGAPSGGHRLPGGKPRFPRDEDAPPIPLPVDELLCTCLDVFATGAVDFIGPVGDQRINPALTGIEIVDLAPTSLEDTIECYAKLLVRHSVFPHVRVPVIRFTVDLLGLAALDFEPTPASGAVAHNPAIETDQLKLLIDIAASAGSGNGGGGGGGEEEEEPPSFPGVPRPRTRTGVFDAQAALSEAVVQRIFAAIREGFSFQAEDSADFGPFSAGYEVDIRLENGKVDLRADGSVALAELDVVALALRVFAGIDIPEICVGGFCVLPTPFGCALRLPRLCVFSGNPDLEIELDLGGLLRCELSARVAPVVKYSTNPGRTPTMNDWDALDAGVPNHWQLYLDPITIDIDLVDVADIVGDLLEEALDDALDSLLGPLPGWAKDLIEAILGPVIDVVRNLLDIGDDVEEWLSNLLGVSFGLFDLILTAVLDHFAAESPLIEFEDPLTMLPADDGLIPVLVPIEFLGVEVSADELTLSVDVGG